ncbi:MAG: hypothetical protein ACI9JO_001569, partial [Psychrobacter okhotskensis]
SQYPLSFATLSNKTPVKSRFKRHYGFMATAVSLSVYELTH